MSRRTARAAKPRGWRLAVSVAVLVYAVLASASGLDRLAGTSFAAEQATPALFRVTADAAAAERLIESGIPESALSATQRLVARDPLGAGSAALLGTALLGQGETARADRAFRLAAQRGWRDPRTQLYWLRVALAQGEPKLAALRFGALARQWPQAPAIAQVAAAFEASAAGRLALAERIAAGDRWTAAYAQPPAAIPATQLTGRAEVLLAAAGLGKRLGCTEISPLVGRLIESDATGAARLWHAHCSEAGAPGRLTDPGFDRTGFAAPRVPFEWEFPGDGALQVEFTAPSGGGRSLQASNSSALTLVFAAQRVALPPGTYRLQINGKPGQGRVLASLSCRREFVHATPLAVVAGRANLTYAGSCGAPWLQLWLSSGSAQVVLDQVELERI